MADTDADRDRDRTDLPPSDLSANPQDTAFGRAAAADQERVEQGDEPVYDENDKTPRPGGKADPQR